MATVAPMQQSMAQVQIPVGIQPGQQFQANMNGMMMMVTWPHDDVMLTSFSASSAPVPVAAASAVLLAAFGRSPLASHAHRD